MPNRFKIERVLFATDFSPACEPAFRYAAGLAKHFNARLYLLHVVPDADSAPGKAGVPGSERCDHQGTALKMRQLRQELLDAHDDYMFAILSGEPAARILEKARQVEADLIVLGVREARATGAGLAADVAQAVCESSPCPVTCVPYQLASVEGRSRASGAAPSSRLGS